jgi:hypothetical protein
MYTRILLILIGISILFPAFSQKEFKKGYIITTDFQRIDGYLANYGKENTSDKYVFRKNKKDNILKLNTNLVREFGYDDGEKFVMAEVLIEVSDSHIQNKNDSTEYTLKWLKKNAFLEIVFEGKLANLYYYNYNGLDNYYLQVKQGKLIPLIYKRYYVTPQSNNAYNQEEIVENNAYKETLFNLLKCKNGKIPKKNVEYTKRSLTDYLLKYHECNDASLYSVLYNSRSATRFNFKGSYFMNFMNFGINDGTTQYYDFPNKTGHSGGIEIEYLIPYNRYKLSLFIETLYQSYNGTYSDPDTHEPTTINYKAISIPLGINYNLHLDKNNLLYARVAVVPNIILNDSYISFYYPENRQEVNSPVNVYFGAGYSFKRFGIEYRYYTRQNLTGKLEVNTHDSDFDHMSLRVFFTFAKTK